MNYKNFKKYTALPLILLMFLSSAWGFFLVRESFSCVYESLRRSGSYPSASVVTINRALAGEREEPVGETQQEEGFIFLSTVSAVPFSGGFLGGLMLLAGIGALFVSGWLCRFGIGIMDSFNASLRYYKNWILEFLSPLQKTILNRCDEYDINPIERFLGVSYPCLAISRTRVFFMGKRG